MMSKNKNMDQQEILIMENLLREDKEIFIKFFNKSDLVDKDFNSGIRQYTKELFEKHSTDKNFDVFILNVYQSMNNKCNKLLNSNAKYDVSTQTVRDAFTQTCSEEEHGDNFIFNKMAHRMVNINLDRNKRCKEIFNPLNFLKIRKISEDYYVLDFQSDDYVEEELSEKNCSLSKKKLDLFADTDLRKIAEHVKALNKMYDYQILNICYDKI